MGMRVRAEVGACIVARRLTSARRVLSSCSARVMRSASSCNALTIAPPSSARALPPPPPPVPPTTCTAATTVDPPAGLPGEISVAEIASSPAEIGDRRGLSHGRGAGAIGTPPASVVLAAAVALCGPSSWRSSVSSEVASRTTSSTGAPPRRTSAHTGSAEGGGGGGVHSERIMASGASATLARDAPSDTWRVAGRGWGGGLGIESRDASEGDGVVTLRPRY